jgi:hypothetical protein
LLRGVALCLVNLELKEMRPGWLRSTP